MLRTVPSPISRILLTLLSMASGLPPREIQKLLEGHHSYLLRLLTFKCRDKVLAEDLLQETYLSFLTCGKDLSGFSNPVKLKNYLITIALNKLRDHCRRLKTKYKFVHSFSSTDALDHALDNLVSPLPDQADKIAQEDQRQKIQYCLDMTMEQLPAHYREILVNKYRGEGTNQSLALAQGLSLKAYESLLVRAKAKFKKEFEKNALKEKVLDLSDVYYIERD